MIARSWRMGLTLACALGLAGCFHELELPELAWDPSPDAVVASATYCCGFVPYIYVLNYIPDAQVWGDGRIVWTTSDDEGRRSVQQGQLAAQDIGDLLSQAAQAGFFNWKDLYEDPMVADASPQCLKIQLVDRTKQVCEYVNGAPAAFHTLYDRFASGLGATGEPYAPERAYVIAHKMLFDTPPDPSQITRDWPTAEAGTSLDALAGGQWIEGRALQLAWDVVNQSPWGNLVQEAGNYYQLSVQIQGLSTAEIPPAF